jgi:hypothetical protein
MSRYTVRPSRGLSALTGVVGLILGLLAIGYFLNRGSSGISLAFVGLWLVGCLALTAYHLFNAATGKGPPIRVIHRDDDQGNGRI